MITLNRRDIMEKGDIALNQDGSYILTVAGFAGDYPTSISGDNPTVYRMTASEIREFVKGRPEALKDDYFTSFHADALAGASTDENIAWFKRYKDGLSQVDIPF